MIRGSSIPTLPAAEEIFDNFSRTLPSIFHSDQPDSNFIKKKSGEMTVLQAKNEYSLEIQLSPTISGDWRIFDFFFKLCEVFATGISEFRSSFTRNQGNHNFPGQKQGAATLSH